MNVIGFFNIHTVIGLNNKAVHCLLSLPPNPSSRCGLMSRGQSEKKLREDTQLHKTQLCMRMNNCKHLWKGDCKFAHDLQDLRPTPSSWTKTKGHHWEPGKPLPDLEVVALIEQYATLSEDLPVWVHELRAQVEKKRRLPDPMEVAIQKRWEAINKEKEKDKVEKERPSPPWKRARSSLSPASLSSPLPPEEGEEEKPKPAQLENKEEGWQSSSYSEDSEEEAAPKPVDRMALLSLAMKAILGYTDLNWPPSGNLSAGGLLLKNLRIGLCLCGIEELKRTLWMLPSSGHWVTVQCGHGKWSTHLKHGPNCHFDLHKWTNYEGQSGGHIPLPDAPTEHKATRFSLLTEDFEAIWRALKQISPSSPNGHRMLILFCKAGRHRSYALLIMFLMWSSHVHDPKMWVAIIGPIRNAVLDKDHPCELCRPEKLKQHSKGQVAFNDVLSDYTAYLNSKLPLHAWPQEELTQF